MWCYTRLGPVKLFCWTWQHLLSRQAQSSLELLRLHVLHPVPGSAPVYGTGGDGLQLPLLQGLTVGEDLESDDEDVVPDGDRQVQLGDDEVEDGGEDGAAEIAGENVGERVAETAGDHVTHNIDLAVAPVVLAGAGGLPEQVDHELGVLPCLPHQARHEGEKEAQARF